MTTMINCPHPAHEDKTPSCAIYNEGTDREHYHCFGCGWHGDMVQFDVDINGMTMRDALAKHGKGNAPLRKWERPKDDDAIRRAGELWRETIPLPGTAGAEYLVSRGVGMDLPANAVRFHPSFPMGYGKEMKLKPSVVARADDVAGNLVAIQALPIDRTTKRTRGRPSRGGVYLGNRNHPVLLVAEGVVTALSAWLLLMQPNTGCCPVAMCGTGNMPKFVPPRTCQRVLVIADNDAAGRKASVALKRNLSVPCDIHLTRFEGRDANDWLAGVAA